MKHLFTLLFVFSTRLVFGQCSGYGQFVNDFDMYKGSPGCDSLWIDTVGGHNIWQVGSPHKSVFDSGFYSHRSIVTDTINPYPVNNNSIFYWKIDNASTGYYNYNVLTGYYFSNTDSLKDYGEVFFSLDTGKTYINITGYQSMFTGQPAVLTGNSNMWRQFRYDFQDLKNMYHFNYNETLIFAFTFHSDSIFDNKDGIMFDDFEFDAYLLEPVQQVEKSNGLSLYPDPAKETIHVRLSNFKNNGNYNFYVSDAMGKMVMQRQSGKGFTDFNLVPLSSGVYIMNITDGTGNLYRQKFVKM